MLGQPSNLIPPLASDTSSSEITSKLFVGALKYDKELKIVPWAAKSYKILNEGRKLHFELRPGIRWHDGKELTAHDVEFTYRLMIDPNTPTAYSSNFKMVKDFNVTDKYTFEISYEKPFAKALSTWTCDILPKHILEKENLLKTSQSRKPVGSGPYKLESWVEGQEIKLAVNPDYFEGRPHIDEVVYRIIPDQATTFLELKSGALDMMSLSPQQYLHQTNGGDWDKDWNKYQYPAFVYTYLGYNLKHPLFSDKRIRVALAHALNKEELVKGVLLGMGKPTIGPYLPDSWVYNQKIKDYSYDPEKAKQLLAEAGWRDTDGDGILDKDGRPFRFTIMTNQGNDLRMKTATIIQYRLKKIGIDVSIRSIEWAAFVNDFIKKGRFDALIMGWTIPLDPDGYDVWHSSKTGPDELNFVGFNNKEVDTLLEKGRESLDQEERKKIYDRIQLILHEEQPYCFLYVPYALPIIRSAVKGVEQAPIGIMHNFIHWWIDSSDLKRPASGGSKGFFYNLFH